MRTRAHWFILDRLHAAEQYGEQALAYQVSRENPKHLNVMIDLNLITQFFEITNSGSEFLNGPAPEGEGKIRVRWERSDPPSEDIRRNLVKVCEAEGRDLFYSPESDSFYIADYDHSVRTLTEWYVSGPMDWESVK